MPRYTKKNLTGNREGSLFPSKGGTMKSNKKEKRGAGKTPRRFIITREYSGKRNLSDIFADLLYAEYCRKEQQGNAK
jgi:hypothetical protein